MLHSHCLDLQAQSWSRPSTHVTCSHAHAGAQQARGEAPDIVLPNQEVQCVRHVALDIGGSLIKLAYFSPGEVDSDMLDASDSEVSEAAVRRYSSNGESSSPATAAPPNARPATDGSQLPPAIPTPPPVKISGASDGAGGVAAAAAASHGLPGQDAQRGGRLHFVKFETSRIDDAIEFIKRKKLHRVRDGCTPGSRPLQVRPL
jgi:bifunctional damage-control phosphatase, subfamily II, fusion protein